MTEARLPAAILGAPGYIGQHFARLLAGHPTFDEPLLVGTARSEGKRLEDVWVLANPPPSELGRLRFRTLGPRALSEAGVRVAFSGLPSGAARTFERALASRGVSVFTNAADLRSEPGVPLLVPEVNPAELDRWRRRSAGRIAANPNCTAIGLALGLAPVWASLGPREIHVSTYQALSGAGLSGLAAARRPGNIVPLIVGEEEKVARETARLLRPIGAGGGKPRFLVQAARVPVRDGHLEAVTVVARRTPSLAELLGAWRSFDPLAGVRLPTAPHPPVVVREESDRPQPVRDLWAGSPRRARGMAVVVGRIRWDPPYLRLFVLSHNAVRGGAGGSVLNAEFAVAQGLVPR